MALENQINSSHLITEEHKKDSEKAIMQYSPVIRVFE